MDVELCTLENGTYEIRDRKEQIPVIVDGTPLTALTLDVASAYLYAIGVLNGIEVAGADPKIRHAIEQSILANSGANAEEMNSVLSAVRSALGDMKIGADIMRPLIKKIAAEHGRILYE